MQEPSSNLTSEDHLSWSDKVEEEELDPPCHEADTGIEAALQQAEDDPVGFASKRSLDQLDVDDQPPTKRRRDKEEGSLNTKKVNNEQWDAMFERLVAYKAKYGDCLVPKRHLEDPKLGTWVETQRVQYKRLDRAVDVSGVETVAPNKRLNLERLEKLESIGFVWSAKHARKGKAAPMNIGRLKKPPGNEGEGGAVPANRSRTNDAQWEHMYERLVQFKEKHGHCLVPRKFEEDPRLASWVDSQRAMWNRTFRDTAVTSVPIPEPTSIPPIADFPSEGKTPDQWDDDLIKDDGGATAEDAAELAATMGEDGLTDEEAQQAAAVVAAAAEAAAEVVDTPLEEAPKTAVSLPKRLSQERKERLDALGFVWNLRKLRIDDHWDLMFRQLVEYKEQHGDCLVPSRYEPNHKLGKWVETQRYEYTKRQRASTGTADPTDTVEGSTTGKPRATNPRLTEERLRRLNSIGFEWKVKHKMKRYYDKQWDQMFERLLKFKEESGHCRVPKRYAADQKLGTWTHTQRIQYRKMLAGKTNDAITDFSAFEDIPSMKPEEEISYRLTEDRRRRLEEVGFCWSAREGDKVAEQGKMTRNSYDEQWDSMFNRLREYKDTCGDCLVPKRFKPDQKLGTWVDTQRVQFKKMKKKLASQGIVYVGPSQPHDNKSGDEGVSSLPDKPIVGRLTNDRIRRLDSLGFVWSLRDDWQQHFEELKAFKERHGHCNVPARYKENRKLGIFERIDLLNNLGFTWSIRSRDALGEYWNQRLEELTKFRDEYGHCNVPSRWSPFPELGTWVGTQRTQYRLYMKAKEEGEPVYGSTAMNEDRIQQLENLGFAWTIRGEDKALKLDPESIDLGDVPFDQDPIQVTGELTEGGVLEDDEVHADILREAIEHAEI